MWHFCVISTLVATGAQTLLWKPREIFTVECGWAKCTYCTFFHCEITFFVWQLQWFINNTWWTFNEGFVIFFFVITDFLSLLQEVKINIVHTIYSGVPPGRQGGMHLDLVVGVWGRGGKESVVLINLWSWFNKPWLYAVLPDNFTIMLLPPFVYIVFVIVFQKNKWLWQENLSLSIRILSSRLYTWTYKFNWQNSL